MPTTITITCPRCQAAYDVAGDLVGRTVRCRECEAVIHVRRPEPAGAARERRRAGPITAEVVEEAGPTSRLTACPDCEGSVSRRAAQCPHCGCPLASGRGRPADGRSTFGAVFAAVLRAVRDRGHAVRSVDKVNGVVRFTTGMSAATFGQDCELVVLDNGDGTCSVDMTATCKGVTDWGEGRRVGERILRAAREHLADAGLPGALGVVEPPAPATPDWPAPANAGVVIFCVVGAVGVLLMAVVMLTAR